MEISDFKVGSTVEIIGNARLMGYQGVVEVVDDDYDDLFVTLTFAPDGDGRLTGRGYWITISDVKLIEY